MPSSQAPQEKRSLEKSNLQPVDTFSGTQQLTDRQSFMSKRSWLRATAISGAAAGMVSSFAGEGVALPAQTNSNEAILPDSAQPEGYTLSNAAQAIDQGAIGQNAVGQNAIGQNAIGQNAATLVAFAQPNDTGFSRSHLQTEPFATKHAARTAQTSLINQAKDGSWQLSTDVSPTDSTVIQRDNAARSQAVISDLAQQAERTQQTCTDRSCRGLAYIDSRLPKAREEVQDLQAQLDDFEAHRVQQDMEGYQKLLSDRIFEIAEQEQDLVVATRQNQQRITQLKTRLVQMDADLELAERALNTDATYQADWHRLIQAERNLMNEFSQVKLDATELNEIYSDYQYHQQQAQLSAGEALGNYLLQAVTVPSFIQRSPDALTFLQELTTYTHEYRLQRLRQTTIGQIQKRLNAREGQLIGDVGEYETLQRELMLAKKVVEEYETEREFILAKQAVQQEAQQTAARSATALDRAKRLAPLVPEGSVAQGVIYTVLAAGAIATIAAYRRNRRVIVPQLALQQPNLARDYSFQPTALQQANLMAAIKLPSLRLSAAQLQTEGAAGFALPAPQHHDATGAATLNTTAFQKHHTASSPTVKGATDSRPLANRWANPLEQTSETLTEEALLQEYLLAAAPAARLHGETPPSTEEMLEEILSAPAPHQSASNGPASDDFEQRMLAELMELTGQTTRMLPAAPENTITTAAEDHLTIEMMVRDLSDAIGPSTPEGSFTQEIKSRQLSPVQLSLNNVNLLAEHAVQWILKDLGISPMAAALDKAEAEAKAAATAKARGWSAEEMAEIEAISIESLEVVQPTGHPEQAGVSPALEAMNREFATVAA
ncbi:MAG: hypothetical protein AB8B99_20375 [Phormidesmis sp.]